MKVKNEKLLLIAAAVWIIAGVNVAGLGLKAYAGETWDLHLWALLIGTVVIFSLFHVKVFSGMVAKHATRIDGYSEPTSYVWKFFDRKSFMIMTGMMTFGIVLRATGIVPSWFIAFFYTGLGLALALAGISFAIRYVKGSKGSCPFHK